MKRERESIYKRYIPAVTAQCELDTPAFWFVFAQNKLLTENSGESVSIPFTEDLHKLGIYPTRTQYLGTLQGSPCFSAEVPADTECPDNMTFGDLRSLYSSLDEDIFMLAGKAIQIVNWDQTHQYCGRCGSHTEDLPGERAKKCPKCGFISYPRISPAVITAILKDNKILLAHNKAFAGNMYSLIAGFVEPGETLEECVKREIMEEVGLKVKNVKYLGSQPWPFPNSLMLGFTAEYESGEISVDGMEIADAGWFDVNNLPELPRKMSIARNIIDWYIANNSK